MATMGPSRESSGIITRQRDGYRRARWGVERAWRFDMGLLIADCRHLATGLGIGDAFSLCFSVGKEFNVARLLDDDSQVVAKEWAMQDSNLRHLPCKGSALAN